ncbi:type II secretion system F family protein [Candidatus Pacearchaeota archaeon]|nr:type II secretion system F family protein [Candidatus Pacearchaeota archaeon]
MVIENSWEKLKAGILKEKRTIHELNYMFNYLRNTDDEKEKRLISRQIKDLKNSLKKTSEDISKILKSIGFSKPLILRERKEIKKELPKHKVKKEKIEKLKKNPFLGLKGISKMGLSELEKETLKRLKRGEEVLKKKKIPKPSKYVELSNKIFGEFSKSLLKKEFFIKLEKDLIKTNLQFTPSNYLSTIIFTTILSIFAGIFLFGFFLFFNIGADLPIITRVVESISSRILKVFWILFAIPLGTFFIMYFYPSLEKKSAENKIDQELPFAVIQMSAISNSMLEPSKIFDIIISTKEYPYLEREFTKIINEINIYGYDLVTALRSVATNNPSKKLTDLLNSLATTIISGGNLPGFFSKRAETLLFEYRLEKEKYTKTAETFMDIYISVVIAAPMILMLLLMMMKISGLGISLSSGMITLLMILGVSVMNIVFLTFLYLKNPNE